MAEREYKEKVRREDDGDCKIERESNEGNNNKSEAITVNEWTDHFEH